MASSIEQLKSNIQSRGGLARPNNFLIELPTLGGVSSESMNVLCRSATLPGKQILTHDRQIGMEREKVAYGYAVDDVTMTFLMTNDYAVRNYFDRWKNIILNEDGQTVKYKNEYQSRVVIHQLANSVPSIMLGANINIGPFSAGKTVGRGFPVGGRLDVTTSVYSVRLEDAFPTTIGEIQLNNDQDGFIEMNVQMSFTNWTTVPAGQKQITFDLPVGSLTL